MDSANLDCASILSYCPIGCRMADDDLPRIKLMWSFGATIDDRLVRPGPVSLHQLEFNMQHSRDLTQKSDGDGDISRGVTGDDGCEGRVLCVASKYSAHVLGVFKAALSCKSKQGPCLGVKVPLMR